jgi:hypothetical protein
MRRGALSSFRSHSDVQAICLDEYRDAVVAVDLLYGTRIVVNVLFWRNLAFSFIGHCRMTIFGLAL